MRCLLVLSFVIIWLILLIVILGIALTYFTGQGLKSLKASIKALSKKLKKKEVINVSKKITTVEDFTVFQNTVNSLSLVAQLQIPQNSIWKAITSIPLKIKLSAYQVFTGVTDTAAFTVTPTYAVAPLMNSTSGTPYYTLIAHAYDTTNNIDLGSPTSIDFSTNAMVFAGSSSGSSSASVSVFYLTSQGSVQIYRETGSANSTRYLLVSGSFMSINVNNPYDKESADYFSAEYPLVSLDKLTVYVNSPAVIILNSTTEGLTLTSNHSVSKIDLPFDTYTGTAEIEALAKSLGIRTK